MATLTNAENEQLQISKSDGSSFAQNDAALSAEAIKAFRLMGVSNKLPYLTFTTSTQNLPKLSISGVDVSIRLDLITRNNGKGTVGGAILQTSKAVASKSWRDDHSKVVASLVWMVSNKHLSGLGKIERKQCLSIDVFGGHLVSAPTSYKRKLNDVEASCSEIAALWDSISPPSDFDG